MLARIKKMAESFCFTESLIALNLSTTGEKRPVGTPWLGLAGISMIIQINNEKVSPGGASGESTCRK